MTCSTCTLLDLLRSIWQLVVFVPNCTSLLCYSESHRRREVEEPSSLYMSYCQVPVEISQKQGICHVRGPVSRDRRILVMEMEVGKPTHVTYLLLIFLHSFCIPNTFCSLGIDSELA